MSTSKRLKAEGEARRKAKREARHARGRNGGLLARPMDVREERVRMLIVCEGEKTEPKCHKRSG